MDYEKKYSEIFNMKKDDLLDMNNLYLRFGDIPENEESKIHHGEETIGSEIGVSVYKAVINGSEIYLGLRLPITKRALFTLQQFIEYDNRHCYLVTGNVVGIGSDNEPLLKDVKIIQEIKEYRRK